MVDFNKISDNYEESELGLIPKHWRICTIEELTPKNKKYCIVDGPFGSNLKTIHYRKSGIPIISSGYVTSGRFNAHEYLYVDNEKFNQEKRSAVKGGDIVIAKIGENCGANAILPLEHPVGILSGNALKITVDEERFSTLLISQILWQQYYSGKFDELKTIGAQPAISITNLKKYKIVLPIAKTEQDLIATALSDTDALIENLEKLIEKKRNIKKGVMQELLTGKSRLNGFKEEWIEIKLGEITSIRKGQLITEKTATNGNIPVIAGGITPSYYHNQANRDSNTITISASGANAGYVSFHTCPIFASDCSTIEDNPAYDIKFIYFLLLLNQAKIFKLQTGGAQPHVYPEQLKEFQIIIPKSKAEQEAISIILINIDDEIKSLDNKLQKYRMMKQGMMQVLLTGKIRLV